MKNYERNLTEGSIPRKLILFALPLFGANLLQSFYSIADMLIVGRFVGQTGLAAISNASMISFIINSVCIGMTMGGTVITAQFAGARDIQSQKETVGTLFTTSLIASIIITVVSLLLYRPVFSLLKVPAGAMEDACAYMQIICAGTVFVFGYNAVCSLMKAFGDSRSPLYFVTVAAIVNIVLDFLLVGPCGMGTKGAAMATVLSQGISFTISILHLRRKNFIFDFRLKSFAVRSDKLYSILKVGFPTAIQMVIVNISYLLITGMLNHFGVAVAAASGIGLKINTFAGMPCWAVGQAVTAMVGQNMGAGYINRVRKIVRTGIWLNILVTFTAVIFVQLAADNIILLFAPGDTDIIKAGVLYLRICCGINSLIYALMYTIDSFAIGTGAAHIAMYNALLDAVVVRLPLSWLLAFSFHLGFTGIYLGQAISPILPAIAGIIYFAGNTWRTQRPV